MKAQQEGLVEGTENGTQYTDTRTADEMKENAAWESLEEAVEKNIKASKAQLDELPCADGTMERRTLCRYLQFEVFKSRNMRTLK